MKSRIVIGNWKMNPTSPVEAKKAWAAIAKATARLKKSSVALALPFIHIPLVASSGKKLLLGAQDVFWEEKGAFTGEISPMMLKHHKVSLVIIGHSERRALGEDDMAVNKKIRAALASGFTVVVCVGEKEHDSEGRYLAFLRQELRAAFQGLSRADLSRIILAYEPIWAIGKTARDAMNPNLLYETVLYLQKILGELYGRELAKKIPILYGGSVEGGNAEELMKQGKVSGFLVGHASLSAETFVPILKAVDTL